MLTKTHLFEARTQGYHTYRIPGLLATGGGVVLATCEARPGGGGDYDDNDILLRRTRVPCFSQRSGEACFCEQK
ncbi:MAG TPA: sialidase family protein, partial [Phycisphaerae bacterium]|nr:sialidase family protein [Phycisphaerae bacterium]